MKIFAPQIRAEKMPRAPKLLGDTNVLANPAAVEILVLDVSARAMTLAQMSSVVSMLFVKLICKADKDCVFALRTSQLEILSENVS